MKEILFHCLAAFLMTILVQATSTACTAFQLQSLDKSWIYFRSMEFGFPFHSQAIIVPRGTAFAGATPDGKEGGLKWAAKYGFVGMNVDVAPEVVADGMNENGLVVSLLYLPGDSEYLPSDPSKSDRTIGSWQVANWLLSTCATVAEARAALEKESAYVAQQDFPPFKGPLPVHFYIADSTGEMIYSNEYQQIRRIFKKDVRSVMALIRQSVEDEEIARRTRADILSRIEDYWILEIDRTPIACVALHVDAHHSLAEMACLYVSKLHENKGYGRKLMAFAENLAREKGVGRIYALSTRTVNYLQQKGGYAETPASFLPEERRLRYEGSGRNSRILVKDLRPKGS